MTVLDRFEALVSLRNLQYFGGEETAAFTATLVIKDKEVAQVRNAGRGGSNIYHWKAPLTNQWANEKLVPLAARLMTAKEPEFTDLYSKSPSTALDSMVFDLVEKERLKRAGQKLASSFFPEGDEPTPTMPPVPKRVFKIGMRVVFGRENGQQTTGKVLKINRTSVQVETLEDRGRHRKGTKFRVAPSLLTPA